MRMRNVEVGLWSQRGWGKCGRFTGAPPRQTETSVWLRTLLLELRSKCGKRVGTRLSRFNYLGIKKHKLLCESLSPQKSLDSKKLFILGIFTHLRSI